jgi:hypothetical protein
VHDFLWKQADAVVQQCQQHRALLLEHLPPIGPYGCRVWNGWPSCSSPCVPLCLLDFPPPSWLS